METRTSSIPAVRVQREMAPSISRWSGLVGRIARLRWFLTPARLAVSLVMFSLGIWSHSAYNSQVIFQNTQLLEQQLNTSAQRIQHLTSRLTDSEARLTEMRSDLETGLGQVHEQLHTMGEKIASGQRAIERLKVRHSHEWKELHHQLSEVRDLNDAKLDQMHWETDRTFDLLARRVDGVRDQMVLTNQTLEAADQKLALVRSIQEKQEVRIDRTVTDIDTIRRWGKYTYVQFNVAGRNHIQSVGLIGVELKKANVRKRRYDAILHLGELTIRKKNRAVNELVTFTVGDEKRPYQLVVKQVARNRIIGYIGIPQSPKSERDSVSKSTTEWGTGPVIAQ